MARISELHGEILCILKKKDSSYARPVKSEDIGRALNISPSYAREMLSELRKRNLVRARRGKGGGYYIYHAGSKSTY
ncbi:MAG: Rrf2 family transcriptional regulator [Firmicutes bacterium]|nr:Rrf2 family transcriptional regulator [Bacillota bacterium]